MNIYDPGVHLQDFIPEQWDYMYLMYFCLLLSENTMAPGEDFFSGSAGDIPLSQTINCIYCQEGIF